MSNGFYFYRVYRRLCAMVLAAVLLANPVMAIEDGLPSDSGAQSAIKSPVWFDGESLARAGGIETPELSCYAAYVINLETGAVIFAKNENDAVYPTSTVKLMTALVAYENIPDLDIVITASPGAVQQSRGVRLGVKAGEKYTARELLSALLISGANDAANVLAEYAGGSIPEFCRMMNEKAVLLGAPDTRYANPTGLHDPDMVTTAADTALIAATLYYHNDLFEFTNTGHEELPAGTLREKPISIYNRNAFISQIRGSEYYYPGAAGLNAGSTSEGGYCLVTTASKRDLTYLCVVMNAKEDAKTNAVLSYSDARALLDMSFDRFDFRTVVSTKNLICEMPVKNSAESDHMTLYPEDEIEALLPVDTDPADIRLDTLIYQEKASAPVVTGDEFGELTALYKGTIIIGKTKLVSRTDIDRSNILYFFSIVEGFVKSRWFRATAGTAAMLFVLYLALSFFVNRRRKKNQYKNPRG